MPLKSRLCSPVCALVCMRPSRSRKLSLGWVCVISYRDPTAKLPGQTRYFIVPGVIAGGFGCCAAE